MDVQAAVQQLKTGSTSTPNSDSPRSDKERQATNYLFGLLAVVFGTKKMNVTFPDEMLVAAKRMYAPQIVRYTRDEIDKGIEYVKQERSKGNQDFEWPNIDRIIGTIREASRLRELHKPYVPEKALLGHDKEVAKKAGRQALDTMKEMFA